MHQITNKRNSLSYQHSQLGLILLSQFKCFQCQFYIIYKIIQLIISFKTFKYCRMTQNYSQKNIQNFHSPTHHNHSNSYYSTVPQSYHNLYSPKNMPSNSSHIACNREIKQSKIIHEKSMDNFIYSPKQTIQILSPSRVHPQNLQKLNVNGREFYFNSPTSYKNSREVSKQTKFVRSPYNQHSQAHQNIYCNNESLQNGQSTQYHQAQQIHKYKILVQEYQKQNNKIQEQNSQILNKIKQKKKMEKVIIERIKLLKGRVDQMKKIKQEHSRRQKQAEAEEAKYVEQINKKNRKGNHKIVQTLEDQFYEANNNNSKQKAASDHIEESLDDSGFPSQLLPPSSNHHFVDEILDQKQSLEGLQNEFNTLLKMSRIQINQHKKQEMRKKMAKLADIMKRLRRNQS